ncbi:helix-turn-helix domain-containing protein [[Leptolyngbya] sp. PCC 7376]|uniref:helix-turn-helix domain-containing protein n=1 Tax=[Leptolyngbya] sp. PCC 7376 TaxID=111781 RepID=UPI0002ED9DF0|nr:IS630 transposase-related protein [[Leptolyngbya] sp. PCC 7376]
MPAAYSDDLRRKALAAVERGIPKKDVCDMFNISRSSLSLWIQRLRHTGSYSAKTGYQKGYGHKIIDLAAFKNFVQQHPDKTQAEMAELWPEDVSRRTISRMLKKIGFTRKKDLWLSRKG